MPFFCQRINNYLLSNICRSLNTRWRYRLFGKCQKSLGGLLPSEGQADCFPHCLNTRTEFSRQWCFFFFSFLSFQYSACTLGWLKNLKTMWHFHFLFCLKFCFVANSLSVDNGENSIRCQDVNGFVTRLCWAIANDLVSHLVIYSLFYFILFWDIFCL